MLGAGAIAASFGADLVASPGSVVQAVAARDPDRARALADRVASVGSVSSVASYGSYAELVADPDVDVVYVATTHAQHSEHALLALEAGKPVLVEKAFALNAGQAAEIVAAARQRGLFCMEAMWTRLHPLVRRAAALAQDGTIGELIGVRADLSGAMPYDPASRFYDPAAGGGALLDMGVYLAHVAWLFLGRPAGVQATGALAPTGVDSTAALQWSYPDGRFAQLATTVRARNPAALLATGTAGWLRLETRLHRPSALTVHRDDPAAPGDASAGWTDSYPTERAWGSFGTEIAEVERCLAAGLTESPAVPLDDTVGVLEVLDEARRQLGVRYPADRNGS